MGECAYDSDSHSCSSSCSSLSSDCPPVYVDGKVMAPLYEAYRVSICSLRGVFEMLYEEDAEDPDLDALLADLCQLEEDTINQLASTNKLLANEEANVTIGTPLSPTKVLDSGSGTEGGPRATGVSSDDFIQFMESLQQSRNIIVDPSRGLSMATYSSVDLSKGAPITISPELTEAEKLELAATGREDIFAEASLLRRSSRASILQRKDSTLGRRKKLPEEGGDPLSPSHKLIQKQLDDFADQLTVDESLTPEQQAQKLKNEKLRIAMMKLKEASVQKMVLKVHNVDGSTKMVAIHEGMNSRDVCILLAERNHQDIGPNWTLFEKLTDLHLERALEDHEKVLDCLSHWPRTHTNHVLFKNNPEKYYLLKRPQLLMPASHNYSSVNQTRTTFSEEQKKNIILKELFKSKLLPKLEGELHIRDGKKSGWKKHLFVLRASGLYYSKTGKSLASRDIVRVVEWKDVECYTGSQYKKFYKAPGHYCFSLVPNGPLTRVEKQIVHLCVSTKHEMMAWMTGIRLAKHGVQLQQDYEDTKAELPWLQLEDENLDQVMTSAPISSKKSRVSESPPTIILQNGREIKPQDLTGKKRGGSLKGSFQFKSPSSENGTPRVSEVFSTHSISGPIQVGGSLRKNRSNQSLLASAFQNAWKQGNLHAEMSQDTVKWPVFNQPAAKRSIHESLREKPSLPFEEENSGMFTLKRKGKNKGKDDSPSPPPPPLPRTASGTMDRPIPRTASATMDRSSIHSQSRNSQASIQTNIF